MTSELDRLERRAQEVRGQLALDLDELFLRLQPRRIARNIAVYARDTQAGDGLGRDVVRDMQRNPIPYLLVRLRRRGTRLGHIELLAIRTASRLPSSARPTSLHRPRPERLRHLRWRRRSGYDGVFNSEYGDPSDFTGRPAAAREISPVTSAER